MLRLKIKIQIPDTTHTVISGHCLECDGPAREQPTLLDGLLRALRVAELMIGISTSLPFNGGNNNQDAFGGLLGTRSWQFVKVADLKNVFLSRPFWAVLCGPWTTPWGKVLWLWLYYRYLSPRCLLCCQARRRSRENSCRMFVPWLPHRVWVLTNGVRTDPTF